MSCNGEGRNSGQAMRNTLRFHSRIILRMAWNKRRLRSVLIQHDSRSNHRRSRASTISKCTNLRTFTSNGTKFHYNHPDCNLRVIKNFSSKRVSPINHKNCIRVTIPINKWTPAQRVKPETLSNRLSAQERHHKKHVRLFAPPIDRSDIALFANMREHVVHILIIRWLHWTYCWSVSKTPLTFIVLELGHAYHKATVCTRLEWPVKNVTVGD